ncbi:MAG TPA: acyl-CoA synthetase FdrA [Thermoanaerobaculia bacterium]
MTILKSEIRRGAYYDSIVLMQLRGALAELDGVVDSGAVMATDANRALLAASGLLPDEARGARPDDLLVVVKAATAAAAADALGRLDALLVRRRATAAGEYRPRSLEGAFDALPEARWVLVSVPGRYAAGVAGQALDHGRHVFLYSDNVALADEAALKAKARSRGLLVMGPDCGTAIVGGVGLGFANRVRCGAVGIVAASGTGLQAVACHVHALGAGVSQALGTGGRDLDAQVGAVTAHQGLELLARDSRTRAIVLVSKPPSPAVATRLLGRALSLGKPVVVDFLGYPPPAPRVGSLFFARGLREAAELAVTLADAEDAGRTDEDGAAPANAHSGYLRGLFSGGTLAYEALQGLRCFVAPLASNVRLDGVERLEDPACSRGHTVVDLGADELTVGRLHPMIDPDLLLRRLRQEAADPEVGVVLLDVVLGHGACADPAERLAPAIEDARRVRKLAVIAVVIGTDEDPQGLDVQVERLRDAGAEVVSSVDAAVERVARRLGRPEDDGFPPVDPEGLEGPIAAVNVGLESFYDSVIAQGAQAVQMDWRPPAGGNERLMAILEKMK